MLQADVNGLLLPRPSRQKSMLIVLDLLDHPKNYIGRLIARSCNLFLHIQSCKCATKKTNCQLKEQNYTYNYLTKS
ncbi:hypothetical protein MtrunA17_Chr1g0178731 [Medicago truncatula]|uniref:Uncharacterized protein n=1 Tax=Medicago truncatula TaxID=3880 RepID=A0A396JTB0_MEDTR|nr:hypothetical protein MtrunA17_Chr1g0178731 [Medicago truncatula]